MQITKTPLDGVLLIEPKVFKDPRGFFLESYQEQRYRDAGIDVSFVQDNHSCSSKDILRGLHVQLSNPQAKLVRVVEGSVFDVAVDLRKDSPTFGKWYGVELSAENFRQLFVPVGFAHGFCVTSERAQFEYKCSNYYNPKHELSILWNDPAIGIRWPVSAPILSPKDEKGALLESVRESLPERWE